jgi:uncharacterized lipoprotein YmbA
MEQRVPITTLSRGIRCLIAGCLISGCVSVPNTNYYTLDMAPSHENAPARVNVVVERLRPSEALARPGLLIKKTPTQVEYYASDHWTANLGELVTQKLSAEFGPIRPDRPTLLLSGTILEFSQVDTAAGAEAQVQLDINVRPEGTSLYREPLLRKTYEITLPARAPSADAVVQALSRALEHLAARVAADLDALPVDTQKPRE